MAPPSSRQIGRWRFSLAVLVPVAICLVATAVASLGFVIWSARDEDQRALARQEALARHVIELQLDRIPHDQQSVTVWDDAVTNTKLHFDPQWIETNIGVWMHSFFGHDDVIVLNERNDPVYMSRGDKTVGIEAAATLLPDLQPVIANLRRKIAGGAIDQYRAGTATSPPYVSELAIVANVPSLISASPIISDSGAIAQPTGTEYLHVSIVHLDAAYARRLSAEYFIPDAQFSRLDSFAPNRAMLPLSNSAGRFVTFFDWERDAPGQALVLQTVPAMLAMFGTAGIVAVFLLYQLWKKSRDLEARRVDAEHQARHDSLTGLANRLSFEDALANALSQRPTRDHQTSVLMLDLDRFKQVNDTLGHRAGDDLIVAVGQRLRQFVTPSDQLSRLGGDEFAILLSHTPGISEPLRLSQRIIEAIGKPFDIFGSEAFVGVSIGIATPDGSEADSRELIRKADIALYEAKTIGRNRAVVFEESMNELLQNRRTIEAELREALRRTDQLSVDFQPLFGKGHAAIIGAEALARWRHPRLGQVSPAHFIPVAEQTGLITALGELVLRRACEMGTQWPGYVIAVNISPAQLRDPHFPQRVFDMLGQTGMRPMDLELEITEGILLEDADSATEALRMLRSAGIRIALDDFGTGYSSLNYLKRYPVDRIKIDRSFVSQLSPGSVSIAIVEAMVTLAHALKIEVTAEGVETREQMEILDKLGCNVFQGFLLSPPISPAGLTALLRQTHEADAQPQVA